VRLGTIAVTAALALAVVVAPASATTGPLPALRTIAADVAAGLTLRAASASVRAQVPNDEYAWIPNSTCLTTAIRSSNATPCVLGDAAATTTVVVFGDSSADQWALDLGKLGTKHAFRVVVYVHAACPVGAITVELAGHGVDPSCATFRNDVLADLEHMTPAPALVVVSELRLSNYVTPSGGSVSNSAWASALTTTLTTVSADGDAALLLHGVPVTTLDPAQCIAANPTALQRCTSKRKAGDPSGYDAATWAGARAAHAAGANVTPLFCTAVACPSVAGGEITHSGNNHVTEAYAAVADAALGELLGCASVQAFGHATAAAAVLRSLLGRRTIAVTEACRALPR